LRIGIVNDSRLAVESISRVLLESGMHSIVWVAANGEDAVEACSRNRPELVLMDMLMPGIDGVECTRRIMMQCPCAILVVTASVDRNCAMVFDAMGAGALDAVGTPVLATDAGRAQFLKKIDQISKVISVDPADGGVRGGSYADALILIGTSAGGPAALAAIFAELPNPLSAAVVVVQHVDRAFAEDMKEWLQRFSPHPVRIPVEGQTLDSGSIWIAGGEGHLVLKSAKTLGYTYHPKDALYCPSVDVLFESAAELWRSRLMAVVLTGMGRDGARSVSRLRAMGHLTIAQDPQTAALQSMPKAAIASGGIVEVHALANISPRIAKWIGVRTDRTDFTQK